MCELCDAGRASTELGATNVTSCVNCSAGTFSSQGSTACDQSGCMDEWAGNHLPSAVVDEGACDHTCAQLRIAAVSAANESHRARDSIKIDFRLMH